MVEAEGDEMRADEPVGRGAADEEGAEEEPEIARLEARPSTLDATTSGLAERGRRRRGGPVSPIGRSPIDVGPSGSRSATIGDHGDERHRHDTERGAPAVVLHDAGENRQEDELPRRAAAVTTPMARPRRAVNQRLTMVAPSTGATEPAPMPTSRPQNRTSCHGARHERAERTPASTTASAPISVRRMPMRCIKAAANGPIRP